MIIPYGIHDVHGTMNWLWSQPTFIPWIPHGIADGFHMDSIWINPGKVKTSPFATPTAPAYGSAPAPPPPPVTHALPVPFAHVTPGRKTRFYSVTVGKCCGVFSNW